MNLYDYLEKRVRILSRTGMSFEGVADEYFYPHETEYGEESISITTDDGDCVEFYEDDIKHIEVL